MRPCPVTAAGTHTLVGGRDSSHCVNAAVSRVESRVANKFLR
jgi:hypothetical protein